MFIQLYLAKEDIPTEKVVLIKSEKMEQYRKQLGRVFDINGEIRKCEKQLRSMEQRKSDLEEAIHHVVEFEELSEINRVVARNQLGIAKLMFHIDYLQRIKIDLEKQFVRLLTLAA